MEMMKGGELYKKLSEIDKFDEPETRSTIRSMLDALKYCHNQGIVHRDLKPENLLYETSDPDSIIKISDFGFARVINNKEYLTTLCGTPVYMAPEIFTDDSYGKECDVWSTGVLLYFMLSGKHPFTMNDVNDAEVAFQGIKNGMMDFPDEDWGNISSEAIDLIKNCLVLNPKERLNIDEILDHKWFSM